MHNDSVAFHNAAKLNEDYTGCNLLKSGRGTATWARKLDRAQNHNVMQDVYQVLLTFHLLARQASAVNVLFARKQRKFGANCNWLLSHFRRVLRKRSAVITRQRAACKVIVGYSRVLSNEHCNLQQQVVDSANEYLRAVCATVGSADCIWNIHNTLMRGEGGAILHSDCSSLSHLIT